MPNSDDTQTPRRPPAAGAQVEATEPSARIVQANGVGLCVEPRGDPAAPAILLISGSASSMLVWEDEFCERLAAGPRFVVRYDNRDTGRSFTYPPGAPQYTLGDLVADAMGLLDAFGLASAHVVGASMGGAIGQLMALEHPDRVASLTLISTSPAVPGSPDPDLPAMADETLAEFAALPLPDWSDRAAVVDYLVEQERLCAGGAAPFDEAAARDLAGRVVDRALNIQSMANHFLLDRGDRWRERLGELALPTLVIHGTVDPVFPYGHALALAKDIHGAHLLTLEQTGHELPRAVWNAVIPAILRHTSGG